VQSGTSLAHLGALVSPRGERVRSFPGRRSSTSAQAHRDAAPEDIQALTTAAKRQSHVVDRAQDRPRRRVRRSGDLSGGAAGSAFARGIHRRGLPQHPGPGSWIQFMAMATQWPRWRRLGKSPGRGGPSCRAAGAGGRGGQWLASRWQWRRAPPLLLLFSACGGQGGHGGGGGRVTVVEVQVVGLQAHERAKPFCCSEGCAAGKVARMLLGAGAVAEKRRPAPHTVAGLGGLYECPCVPLSARVQFEEAVVEDASRHWRASGSQRGLTYLSLGAGGLFSDLMVLAGLLARGVRVSTVVLIDTIYEELIAAFQSPCAPPAPSTFAASGGSIVEEDPATGLVRLTVSWRGSPATERQSRDPCEVRGAARCRQCQDAASLVPMPPAHGLGVVDLVANFCGWLSLAAVTHAGPEALDSRQAPRVFVLGHLARLACRPCEGSSASPDADASGTTSVTLLPRADVAVFADLHADAEVTPPCAPFTRYREGGGERERDVRTCMCVRVFVCVCMSPCLCVCLCVCVCARACLCVPPRLLHGSRASAWTACSQILPRFVLLAGRKIRKLDQRPDARHLVSGLPLAFWASAGGWPLAHSAFHRLSSGRADFVWRTGCGVWRGTRTRRWT